MSNTDDQSILRKSVDAIHPLTQEAWSEFLPRWSEFSVKRKETITASGEVEQYLYFVLDGVQRIFYFDDQDREATIVLTYATSFGGVLDSLMLKKPSAFYYESLTPSRFLRAHTADVHAMITKHACIAEMVQLGITNSFSGLLERMVELQCFSSEDKFRKLLKRSPHILTLVPHKYLANYLGIDPTNFSKLMNSVRI